VGGYGVTSLISCRIVKISLHPVDANLRAAKNNKRPARILSLERVIGRAHRRNRIHHSSVKGIKAMPEAAALKRAPRPTDKHVGGRIRMRRHMLGMTQETLGNAIGVTFQQIQKYENGKNRIGAGRLQQIADALSCEPAWFFEGTSNASETNGKEMAHVDTELAAFFAERHAPLVVRGFVRLAPQLKRAIANVIAAVADQPEEA
jgi:transcriptional regulator with XRE-family HTH domain